MGTRRRHLALLVALPLLLVQGLGSGAIALAHARDAVTAPAAFESTHDGRCPILHDAVRCALCHYSSARVAAAATASSVPLRPARVRGGPAVRRVVPAAVARYTAPTRGPPPTTPS